MPEFSGYIYDGYTRKGYVEKKEYTHPAVRFEWRPLLAQDRAIVNSQIAKLYTQEKNAEGERLAADAIARRMVSWNLVGAEKDGEVVLITLTNMLRVEPVLLSRIFGIMMGTSQSDADPEWSNEETNSHTAENLEAALSGNNSATALEESAAKN